MPPPAPALPDEGFAWVEGLQLHWRGAGETLRVHPPGRSLVHDGTPQTAFELDYPGSRCEGADPQRRTQFPRLSEVVL